MVLVIWENVTELPLDSENVNSLETSFRIILSVWMNLTPTWKFFVFLNY